MTDSIQQLRDRITRTDAALPPLTREQLAVRGQAERGRVASGVAQAHVGAAMTLQAMAVYDDFLAAAGATSLADTSPDDAVRYVEAVKDLAAQHLRRNCLHACYALEAAAGRLDVPEALSGMRIEAARTLLDRPSQSRLGNIVKAPAQTVCATTDEMLVMRVSAVLARAEEPDRCAAAVAISSSGASLREAPAICLGHHVVLDPKQPWLELPGRHLDNPGHGSHLKPRHNRLDPWAHRSLERWAGALLARRNPTGASSSTSADDNLSFIYHGRAGLQSESAIGTFNNALLLAREAAGLPHAPGTTPGGLYFWHSAYTATTQGLDAAAESHGTDVLNMLRQLMHASDRAYSWPEG